MTETQTPTVDSIFAQMGAQFRSDKAAGMNAKFQFNITGDGGGEWYASIENGACTVSEGTVDGPTVTINASAGDWVDIVTGKLNSQMAFMQGKLRVQGDLGLTSKLQSLFF